MISSFPFATELMVGSIQPMAQTFDNNDFIAYVIQSFTHVIPSRPPRSADLRLPFCEHAPALQPNVLPSRPETVVLLASSHLIMAKKSFVAGFQTI